MSNRSRASEIVDEAVERTGLGELGDDWFLVPLEAWTEEVGGEPAWIGPRWTDESRWRKRTGP